MAPRRPRLPQLLFLVVAAFLLTNKVWSPQYSLWLLPLAVLARPSWRALLAWQVTECLVWVPRLLWFLGTGAKGVDYEWFFGAVLLRDLAVLALAALVVRDVLRPELDIVRAPDRPGGAAEDDPAGGVLDWADDRGPLVLPGVRSGGGPDLIDGDDTQEHHVEQGQQHRLGPDAEHRRLLGQPEVAALGDVVIPAEQPDVEQQVDREVATPTNPSGSAAGRRTAAATARTAASRPC